jgi:hypothetical protein
MTVLPNIKKQGAMAGMVNTWHSTLNDDSLMSGLVCPLVVSANSLTALHEQVSSSCWSCAGCALLCMSPLVH